jgi:nicotinamidase-related amidase
LAVEAAARDAHDRDFRVVIVDDACIAANDDDHIASLKTARKFADVMLVADAKRSLQDATRTEG